MTIPQEKALLALRLLVEGSSVRSIAELRAHERQGGRGSGPVGEEARGDDNLSELVERLNADRRRRHGSPCQCPAMANGRCRIHGGLSTGPKTAEGIARIRRAVTKHGRYSAAAKIERKQYRALLREGRELMRRMRNEFVG